MPTQSQSLHARQMHFRAADVSFCDAMKYRLRTRAVVELTHTGDSTSVLLRGRPTLLIGKRALVGGIAAGVDR
jgi:hypothetical protein